MATSFGGEPEPIGELFSGSAFYRVPIYQRPFSWGAENFEDLFDDIWDADWSADYFLGTIVLHQDDGEYQIVDGQQRLSSLAILFACLRDLIDDPQFSKNVHDSIFQEENKLKQIPNKVRILVRENLVFEELVAEQGGTGKDFSAKSLSETALRYIEAAKIFRSRLMDLPQEKRQEMATFVSQRCKVIRLAVT
jgi:uncharacterized protein with ParB-like and HNH nuclease domain